MHEGAAGRRTEIQTLLTSGQIGPHARIRFFPVRVCTRGALCTVMRSDTGSIVRTSADGARAIELLRGGATLDDARGQIARIHQCGVDDVDLTPLFESLAYADMIRSIDDVRYAPGQSSVSWLRVVASWLQVRALVWLAAYCPLRVLSAVLSIGGRRDPALIGQIGDRIAARLNVSVDVAMRLARTNADAMRRSYAERVMIGLLPVRRLDRWLTRDIPLTGREYVAEARSRGKGIVFCGYHFGSHSIVPFVLGRVEPPVTVLVADVAGAADDINNRIAEWRAAGYTCALEAISGAMAMRTLARRLRQGESVLVLADVPGGLAAIQWLTEFTGAPILPVILETDADGSRRLIVHAAVKVDAALPVLDRAVERQPAQWLRWVRLGVAAVALAATVRAGSTTHAQPPAPTYRAETDLVRIVATVSDADGRPVTNLGKEHFAVAEDGAPQEIALFTRDVETPLSVMLVIDVSGSMADELDAVRRGVRAYVETLRPDDEVGLVAFARRTGTMARFSDSRERLLEALDGLTSGGGTALYKGMVEGTRMLATGRHRKKVILLVTDGNNTVRGTRRRTATRAVQQSEALVYALAIGHSNRDSFVGRIAAKLNGPRMGLLRDLTESSGGRAELVDDLNGSGRDLVVRTIARFGEELRQQYTLGYYPPVNRTGNRIRQVRITTSSPQYVVRSRKVYLAR